MALKHPERVTGLIVQNGNAYDEGLKEFWNPIKKYWADGSDTSRKALLKLFTLETTKFQYTDGMSDVSASRRTTGCMIRRCLIARATTISSLICSTITGPTCRFIPPCRHIFVNINRQRSSSGGKNDYIFPADGAYPYKRDLPEVEFHLIDTGHFALEDKFDEMVPLIRDFLSRKVA